MLGNPQYPSYQVFLSAALSALLVLVIMPFFVKLLRREGIGQQIRDDGPQSHLQKQGTPTMGGLVMLVAVTITCVAQATWTPALVLAVAVMLATGFLGFLDDAESVFHGRSLGLTPLQKMAGLTVVSVAFCLLAVNWCGVVPTVTLPFGPTFDLGSLTTVLPVAGGIAVPWLYLFFVFLLLAGFSNAVNLTDGLDGLAGGCILVVMTIMSMVAFSQDMLPLSILAASIAGACIGFLWFNGHPASIFMGDTGSLALGATLATIAVLTKTEVTSLVMGGLFIAEALSVIMQVGYFKLTHGKRIFLMSPLHHHFEQLGWDETKVVIRFWIISAALAVLGFALHFSM